MTHDEWTRLYAEHAAQIAAMKRELEAMKEAIDRLRATVLRRS